MKSLTHKKLKGPREIYRAMCQTKVVDIYILLLFDISRDRLAEDTLNTSRIRPIFYASRALFAPTSRSLPHWKTRAAALGSTSQSPLSPPTIPP